ncbi:MAG: SDR family NAD(P)-dependent oxidoreductase [Parvibaculales bacterium]
MDRSKFKDTYGPWALITGGTEGIGLCFAEQLAEAGLNIALVARREELLTQICSRLGQDHGIQTRHITADLSDPEGVVSVIEAMQGVEVSLVIHNAGATHGAKAFLDQPCETAEALMTLNCLTPLRLSHHFGQAMKDKGAGGLIMMNSLACLAGASAITPYSAAKAYLMRLSEGLWHEFKPYGVDVLTVLAGATRTPAMVKSIPGFETDDSLMAPEQVAGEALAFLGRGPVCVPGGNKEAAAFMMSPDRVGLVNMMSKATADLYGLEGVEHAGENFSEG